MRGEQGSALLVALMVMVGLSLLGLGFVAISESESAISVNERNYAQTLAVAKSARRPRGVVSGSLVGHRRGYRKRNEVPARANIDAFKRDRTVGGTNIGKYKPIP